jgi:hypothetical protein
MEPIGFYKDPDPVNADTDPDPGLANTLSFFNFFAFFKSIYFLPANLE